ncbi:MAG: SAM-dependent methyltransferase [Rhodospirillales bacterium]|nr:SAM-dependent methyltransferase [Rhodospirillales bacterium]
MKAWLDFWNEDHPIYVNETHRRIHYRQIAIDMLTLLPARPGLCVLDYGCGEAMPPASCDAIFATSLVQYLDRETLKSLLRAWRERLRPDGELIVADVIPPDAGMIADVTALLRTGWAHGFLGAALAGLVRTLFSDYRRLRRQLGLAVYSERQIFDLLRDAGFTARRNAHNLGFNPRRMTFIARRQI